MTEFQALITGAVHGALAKVSGEGTFLIDVEPEMDDHGYTNKVFVTGRESGEQLVITIEPRYDTPESVEEKLASVTLAKEAAQRHLG